MVSKTMNRISEFLVKNLQHRYDFIAEGVENRV